MLRDWCSWNSVIQQAKKESKLYQKNHRTSHKTKCYSRKTQNLGLCMDRLAIFGLPVIGVKTCSSDSEHGPVFWIHEILKMLLTIQL